MDFSVPTEHWVKMKVSEKRNKYLDFAKEQKKKRRKVEHEDGDDCCDWHLWNNL